MSFKLQDLKCSDCGHSAEYLVDSNEQTKCQHCGSDKLTTELTAGTGNKTHISWSKWRAV